MVLNSIISQHLSRKDFKLCLVLLNELVGLCGEGDPNVLSKLGYVKMQYGDVEGAKKAFKLVEGMVNSGSEVCLRNLVSRNKALLFIVEKDYVSAVREYEECIERDGMDMVAMNNKALCLMYSRDLSDAIKVLENALERVPTVALNETLVVNLCSMYELAYVNHADIKRTLNSWIARVAPDDFDASCDLLCFDCQNGRGDDHGRIGMKWLNLNLRPPIGFQATLIPQLNLGKTTPNRSGVTPLATHIGAGKRMMMLYRGQIHYHQTPTIVRQMYEA
ncbi:hypothetical protein CQW23_12674 [Capsicum baccatum]|uniref:Uncharacterized protein n=1 Tax=Capsicum baccatum TaxID=33114 RepID=A0A2G2WT77_CAPBA|nr:hypothetical protein CQW23_12674 [Capsicum baccatum]